LGSQIVYKVGIMLQCCVLLLAQHFSSLDLKFLYRLTIRAWFAINLALFVPMCPMFNL